jgi:hypothetical protein
MVFRDLLFGRFAVYTWSSVLGGMLFPFAMLFFQGVNSRVCSIPLTVVAALLINVGLWTTRALVVVPSFYHPLLPWSVAAYTPTLPEWCIVIGSFFMFSLLLLAMIKALPVLELPEEHDRPVQVPAMPFWKKLVVGASLVAGIALVASGVSVRLSPEFFHPPAIWLSGIVLLLSVPFQICVLPERRLGRVVGPHAGQRVVPARRTDVSRYLAVPSPRLVLTAPVRAIPTAVSAKQIGEGPA